MLLLNFLFYVKKKYYICNIRRRYNKLKKIVKIIDKKICRKSAEMQKSCPIKTFFYTREFYKKKVNHGQDFCISADFKLIKILYSKL